MNTPKLPPLPERLRDAARKLRTSSIPLADFIPLLQQAADAIAAQDVPDAMRTALQRIADWKSHDLQLAVGRGSNGVRDFYRQIAIDALASAPPAPQSWPLPGWKVQQAKPQPLKLPPGRCASDWGGRATGPFLYTDDEVMEILQKRVAVKEKPLSEDEIRDAVNGTGLVFTAPDIQVARAIEAAHGIKE